MLGRQYILFFHKLPTQMQGRGHKQATIASFNL